MTRLEGGTIKQRKTNKPKTKPTFYQLLQYNFVLILYFRWLVI